MFYEVNRTSPIDDTFVSSATMRAHVRAIDESEDDLLDIYRDAAVDYLQNLSDRVLGLSTAKVLLDYSEFRAPFRIQKLQGITSVLSLEYFENGVFTKHIPVVPADEVHGHHFVQLSFTGGTAVNRVVDVDVFNTSVDVQQLVTDTSDTPSAITHTLSRYNWHTEQYVQVDTASGSGGYTVHTFQNLQAGLYRIDGTVTGDHTHTSSSYFAINNGTLFKHTAMTDQYPSQFDYSELCQQLSEGGEKMSFRLRVSCGTALGSLPKQYVQAALLLIGHYYNMREAEIVGGITTEVKEGVRRLVSSVRQY